MSDIKHFLIAEIDNCRERVADYPSPFFNGVNVGYKKSKKLTDKHILFCKRLLSIIENEGNKDD